MEAPIMETAKDEDTEKKQTESGDSLSENKDDDAKRGSIVFGDDDDDEEENGGGAKSHTFRQRRLTYTRNHLLEAMTSAELQDLDISDDDDDEDDQVANTATALVVSKNSDEIKNTPTTTAHDSTEKDEESKVQLESRVLHASAPPVPNDCPTRKRSLLYIHHNLHQNQQESKQQPYGSGGKLISGSGSGSGSTGSRMNDTDFAPHSSPAEWKKQRHTSPKDEDDSALPFPRHIVGTYSCHGIEPVYDEGDSNAPAVIAKINQDRGGIAFPYANNPRMAVFAAYDGHGDGGEHVSQYALHEIPKRLEHHQDFLKGDIEKAFIDVFVNVDKDLTREEEIEPLYSGCTACVALLKDKVLYLSNAGDSRAVMASSRNSGSSNSNKIVYKAIDLTVDQNPDSPGEQERIEKMGGFVSPPPEEGLSARVWLDCNYSQIGLAMSRSLGDHVVKSVGVISTPVVTKHQVHEKDAFMIIATDGVWEFLSSQQAVDIVSKDLDNGKGSSVACQNLIEAAAAMWHKHEGGYRDDITALIIKVNELWEN